MQKFVDGLGREWSIDISFHELTAMREKADLDLMSIETFQRLVALPDFDAVRDLGKMLWVLVEKQAHDAGIDQIAFAKGLRGGSLEMAARAIEEELLIFFPSKRADVLRELAQKTRQFDDMALDNAREKLASPELARQMKTAIETGKAPEHPEANKQ